jgi:CotH protein
VAAPKRKLGIALSAAALSTAVIAVTGLSAGAAAQSQRLDLPVVLIDSPEEIVDNPKRAATMRVFDRDRQEHYNGPIGIELRGFSSQRFFPKKSYSVEVRNASGEGRDVPLLGMPADHDWALIANYIDESLLRNFVVYSTARWAGRYAARTRLVEVMVNDDYEGVYLLVEDLKLDKHRVAVDDSDVSGGYLLEMVGMQRINDTPQSEEFFATPVQDQGVVYEDPDRDDLSSARATWIRRYVNRFERRLYGKRFRSRRRGYQRYLEVDAAVDYVLLNEVFRNADTFRWSTYMHKSVGEQLVLGPLWDFDHAVGNDTDNATTGWQYAASPWAGRLYADPAFRQRLTTRWSDLRKDGLRRHIMRTIDRGAGQLARGPQERNFSRWPIFGTDQAKPDDPRTGEPPANHAEAVDYLKWWLRQRIDWIDGHVNSLRPR